MRTLPIFALLAALALPLAAESPAAPASAGTYGAPVAAEGETLAVASALDRAAELNGKSVRLTGFVTAACQVKGCWIALAAGDGREMRVTFRDYGFFVPKDLPGSTVVAEGTLTVREISVKEQKHLATDAGRPKAEIEAIKAPKTETELVADGVRVIVAAP
ncbi:MAG TPA: DUF4920 domain-containing protein [Thermoanaerobaculia bacterium]|jgi:hypothetical protein|nr:DUF4920 domain-containing protein [Thermoanaerobaculia bacterium]